MVIPVIAFVKGDAKSGNTLVSQFGGKNCTFSVPRLCFTGLKHLDDPMHMCCWVQMVDQKALNDKVTDLLVSPPNETNKNKKGRNTLQPLTACQHITAKMPFLTYNLDTIHLASCLPHHQTWCISMSLASSSESVNHSHTQCLPMLKSPLTIWWKTYFGHSVQCWAAALISFAPTFVVEPFT
jgi:hypothetical protein